ncbi:hypothetical protein Leucomu_03610 [Leucobacter muris]|uniref:Uncharacterized protein n=1 Tax=Leucobacter muris TaxID=1935379 RepID=A0ABX5QDI9_9MICO|nr:hypothetical protein [Leucobacter muris]QAB17129.1 hypothetical protein Leucomu_03610 [Leucobacter muris]
MPDTEQAEIEPFATVAELKVRWPGFPAGADELAKVHLADASQFILDVAPSALRASPSTRRRIVCKVVRRAMRADLDPELEELEGFESAQTGAGPFQDTLKPINPHGDYYLTGQEKRALGVGRQRAGSINMLAGRDA